MINYSIALISKDIQMPLYYNLHHRVKFDYKLKDITMSKTEKLVIELLSGDLYFTDTILNDGNTDWVHFNKFFPFKCIFDAKMIFTALGKSSANIHSWLIDNIVFEICSPTPIHVKGTVEISNQYDIVALKWAICLTPSGARPLGYSDGSFENGFASPDGGMGLGQLFRTSEFSYLSYPYTIYSVGYFNDDYGNPGQEEQVFVLSGDGENILAGPYSQKNQPGGERVWLFIEPVVIDSGDFMIATLNVLPDGPFIGADMHNYNESLYFGAIGD
jgi:hypothetical protein